MFKQLSLPVRLNDYATLDNYYVPAGSTNSDVLNVLRSFQDYPHVFIWGDASSGVSHLLQATCQRASADGLSSIYLPLKDFQAAENPEELLVGIETTQLVCIDDLDSVISNSSWSEQLFHMFNRCLITRSSIVFGANSSPAALEVVLPDLESRLRSCLTYKLVKLSDSEKLDALVFRAKRRGMDMPGNVADYIATRFSRNLTDQFDLLERLDRLSLIEKRVLTIPFVKKVIEETSDD